ncbi:hypothetical protein KUTeg_002514 [Tegillarca granosa]|uniref:VWFA domain-containing protein n=1 Tax=Tegillarca granosa TaxID=220873 RepID=A0ABQ9FVV0_TEGGR|nr:hypothetical protein KUTeg_002514 [Tegillarca granosa]
MEKMAAVLPGGSFEICFSFDTTGSMSSCIEEVKGRLQDMIQRLQADIPGIRIAVFAHGDYCDKGRTYVTKYIDFSTDVAELCTWVKSVEATGGGDSDECYELVLHEVQSLSWTPGTKRALVMIGDADPHEPNYGMNKKKLNWRNETEKLAEMAVRIYSVECRGYSSPTDFYQTIADKTSGKRLKLEQFANIFDFIMAICYREKGDEFLHDYEKEVRSRNPKTGIHKDLDSMFGELRDDEKMDTSKPGLTKVPSLTKPPSIGTLKKAASITPKHKTVSKTLTKSITEKKIEKRKARLQKNYLPKLRRENVPETNFMLKNKKWTPWELVISPTVPSSESVDNWEKRRGDIISFKKKTVFSDKNTKPALYEFSVQIAPHSKRYVLYCRSCKGFPSQQSWESRLLGRKDIKNQINDVIEKGCCVFVRRMMLRRSSSEAVSSALHRYDYAWRRMRKMRNTHRQVEKSLIELSSEKF